MRSCLLTGDAGFIGTQFRKWFAANEPRAVIRCVDIKNGEDARDFFRKDNDQFDLVIHLAAVVGGRVKIDGAPLEVAVDLGIDSLFFEWALRTEPRHIVYYSSSAAYPTYLQTDRRRVVLEESDINLTDICQPDQTYGLAKLVGEVQAHHAAKQGLNVSVFRPFSGYGETQVLDYPAPAVVTRATRRESPIQIWSDSVRDFVHVSDVVAATMAAVEAGFTGTANLCTGRATSFSEFARIAMDTVGYNAPVEVLTNMPSGVHYRVGDPATMRTFYTPKISLEEGIARMVKALT